MNSPSLSASNEKKPFLRIHTSSDSHASNSNRSSVSTTPNSLPASLCCDSPYSLSSLISRNDEDDDDELLNSPRLPPTKYTNSPSQTVMADVSTRLVQVENVRLQTQIAHLRSTLDNERTRFTEVLRNLQLRSKAEINTIRTKQVHLETEIPVLRQRLRFEKDQVNQIDISEALYRELCQKPEESLSILELIQKRVHLLVQTPKSELEIVRKKLEQQLKQTTPHVEENVPRQMNCEVETANMKFEQEQMKWKKKERELNEKLSSTEMEWNTTRHQMELLTMDKEYLSREMKNAQHQLTKSNQQISILQTQVDEAEEKKRNVMEQFHQLQNENKSNYQHKMEKELERLSELHEKEFQHLREKGQALWERENQILREARDHAVNELQRVQLKCTELERFQSEQFVSHSRVETKNENLMTEVRNELKLQQLEKSRFQQQYESTRQKLDQKELEIDMLQHKIKVHEEEFFHLETQSAKTISEMENAIKHEREKQMKYETMESDVEDLLIQLSSSANGHLNDNVLGSQVSSSMNISNNKSFRSWSKSIPFIQKFTQQSQKIQELEIEIEQAQMKIKEQQSRAQQMKEQSQHLSQPKEYLVKQLMEKDSVIDRCQHQIAQLSQALNSAREKRQQCESHSREMKKEMIELLKKREDYNEFKAYVATHTQKQTKESQQQEKTLDKTVSQKNNEAALLKNNILSPVTNATPPKWYQRMSNNNECAIKP